MRILHVITSLRPGGAERLMTDLLPRFKRDGIEIDILLFNGTETPFKQKLRNDGIRIFDLSKGGSVYSPLHIVRLVPYLRKYDIVHTHMTAPQLFAAVARLFARTHLVTTEHSTNNRRRSMRWYRPMDRWMYRQYSRIITISEKAEETLKKHLDDPRTARNITTICNGIDIRAFAAASPDAEIRTKYDRCKRLMMVSRFAPAKDQKTVIRAMALLPEEYHLFFAGDGALRGECESLARELNLADRVHFLGIRTNIPELFKSAHIAILSSHWEGMPLSAIEAMAARKPLVASDVDGIYEMVKGAGVLFEHGNAQDLADKIQMLFVDEDLYRTTAVKCSVRAEKYGIEKTSSSYEEIYFQLTSNNSL